MVYQTPISWSLLQPANFHSAFNKRCFTFDDSLWYLMAVETMATARLNFVYWLVMFDFHQLFIAAFSMDAIAWINDTLAMTASVLLLLLLLDSIFSSIRKVNIICGSSGKLYEIVWEMQYNQFYNVLKTDTLINYPFRDLCMIKRGKCYVFNLYFFVRLFICLLVGLFPPPQKVSSAETTRPSLPSRANQSLLI